MSRDQYRARIVGCAGRVLKLSEGETVAVDWIAEELDLSGVYQPIDLTTLAAAELVISAKPGGDALASFTFADIEIVPTDAANGLFETRFTAAKTSTLPTDCPLALELWIQTGAIGPLSIARACDWIATVCASTVAGNIDVTPTVPLITQLALGISGSTFFVNSGIEYIDGDAGDVAGDVITADAAGNDLVTIAAPLGTMGIPQTLLNANSVARMETIASTGDHAWGCFVVADDGPLDPGRFYCADGAANLTLGNWISVGGGALAAGGPSVPAGWRQVETSVRQQLSSAWQGATPIARCGGHVFPRRTASAALALAYTSAYSTEWNVTPGNINVRDQESSDPVRDVQMGQWYLVFQLRAFAGATSVRLHHLVARAGIE